MLSFIKEFAHPTHNCWKAAILLVDLLNVKITHDKLTRLIEQHPDFPSLLSISDVLKGFGIDTISAIFSSEALTRLPAPFIATISAHDKNKLYFSVVKQIDDQEITFYDPQRSKWVTTQHDIFFKRYSGHILICEVNDQAGDSDYKKLELYRKQRSLLTSLSVIVAGLLIFIACFHAYSLLGVSALSALLSVGLTIIGITISGLLVWHEIDRQNPMLISICKFGAKVNCELVLNSKASKLFGVSCSTIGLTYFAGNLLILMLNGIINRQSHLVIAWLNILSLPYVIFSLFYQWKIVKSWCTWCLGIQSILILQTIVFYLAGWLTVEGLGIIAKPYLVTSTLTIYLISFWFIQNSVAALKNANENERSSNRIQQIKNNPIVFGALLKSGVTNNVSTDGLGILLGNPGATNKIIKVCSLYCSPCGKALKPLEQLLNYDDDLQIQIIFSSRFALDDSRNLPMKHLLGIADVLGEDVFKQALNEWYAGDRFDYNKFISKYSFLNMDKHEKKITDMNAWCKKSHITYTPTIYINGYRLPQQYDVEDLKYCLVPKNG